MNGVISAWVSAGSNQFGARETWSPQVSSLCGAAANAARRLPGTTPSAASARTSRRRIPGRTPTGSACRRRRGEAMTLPSRQPLGTGSANNLERSSPWCLPYLRARWGFRDGSGEGGSAALDRDVLVRPGIGKGRDQPEPGFADPRPDAVDERQLPDRRGDRALLDQLLHLVEDRCALGMIELDRLFVVELVDVGIAAIDIGAALDGERSHPCGGVAEGAAAAQHQVLVFLFAITLQEGRTFDRPQRG